jgi:NAD(P)-dependent dehydrogenase (short-subunit alcohol dehydrogenase family)
VVSGRRRERLDEVAHLVEERGVRALALPCDVREEKQQQRAVTQIISALGKLDVAIANAGYSIGGRVATLTADDWRNQLDTNVVGAAITARFALPELKKTRGRLALIGSASAFFSAPGYGAYHCSKHALRALGQTLSIELTGSGVSCTTVHPGFVESEIQQVDRQGHFDASREDRRPSYLMWPADRAARTIVTAIARRRREVVFTGHGKLIAFMGMHVPRLVDALMSLGPMQSQAEGMGVDEEMVAGDERR